MINATILIDNIHESNGLLCCEHGLSMLVETDKTRILLDTGLSGAFFDNAFKLGINLSNNPDFCFLSHGHNDHTGGLQRFLEINDHTPVVMSHEIRGNRYFSSRHTPKRDLSTNTALFDKYADRFKFITESLWLTPQIAAVCCTHHEYPSPIGNLFLTKEVCGKETADDFQHEMALAIKSDEG